MNIGVRDNFIKIFLWFYFIINVFYGLENVKDGKLRKFCIEMSFKW